MRNITVSVADETYTLARVWAAQRNTSISAVVAYVLRTLPNMQRVINAFPVPAFRPIPPNSVLPTPPLSNTNTAVSTTSNPSNTPDSL